MTMMMEIVNRHQILKEVGKRALPIVGPISPLFPGKGRPTIGVGPLSMGGSIRADSKETTCGAKRMGLG